MFRRFQLPFIALGLFALVGASSLGVALHYWLVPHGYCAQSGAVVHKSECHHAQTSALSSRTDHTDECQSAFLGQRRFLRSAPLEQFLVSVPTRFAPLPYISVSLSVARYAYAPKNSPPQI